MVRINVSKTGQNIRSIRKQSGIKVRQMQEILGFENPGAIYSWERGRTLPTIDNLVILADFFGERIEDILVVEDI